MPEIKSSKPSMAFLVLLWIILVATVLGQIFKIMHWPLAGILMLISTFTFTLFYLPLYILENWKNRITSSSKLSLLLETAVVFIFSLGFLFKTMHWRGSEVLYVLDHVILVIVVMPYAIYWIRKTSKDNLNKTHHLLIIFYFFALYMGALFNSSSGKVKISSLLKQVDFSENAYRTASSRNTQFYTTYLTNTSFVHKPATDQQVLTLQSLSNRSLAKISAIKSHLISSIDHCEPAIADTLKASNILHKQEMDQVEEIMIGNMYQPKKDIYSAYALKKVISNFHDSVLQLIQTNNRALISEGLNLNTDNYFDEESNELLTWEVANFKGQPLIQVIDQLTNLQYEIRNAEFQAQIEIINSNQSDNSSQSPKIDLETRVREIAKLKRDNEMGMEILNSKNSEIEDLGNTVFGFIATILLFCALVFFIIRANLLRRRANKVLQEQKEIIENQKENAEHQRHLIEEKQKEILDSIAYAKRLQDATLPHQDFIDKHLPHHFILYLPKDIVAGDFYWAEHKNDKMYVAAADSTGHGVPGAMVSMVCSNALNRSVKEFNEQSTGKILDKTRELVIEAFAKNSKDVKDGMDISLLCVDYLNRKITWSGANNPLWYFQDGTIKEIKADKQPIGNSDHYQSFTTHEMELREGSIYYLFTDGFADQFGGPKGKKFKYKQLEELVQTHSDMTLPEQKQIFHTTFNHWKAELEQVDDICIIGIRV